MNAAIRKSAFFIILACCTSCGDSRPTSPTAITSPSPSVTPGPSTSVPPLSGPSRTFNFERPLSYSVSAYTRSSRFILYDDGGFVLEYPSIAAAYRGRYTEANGDITFDWEGWSTAGAWGATGTVKGDLLTVEYNLIMGSTDFENAVYTLIQ